MEVRGRKGGGAAHRGRGKGSCSARTTQQPASSSESSETGSYLEPQGRSINLLLVRFNWFLHHVQLLSSACFVLPSWSADPGSAPLPCATTIASRPGRARCEVRHTLRRRMIVAPSAKRQAQPVPLSLAFAVCKLYTSSTLACKKKNKNNVAPPSPQTSKQPRARGLPSLLVPNRRDERFDRWGGSSCTHGANNNAASTPLGAAHKTRKQTQLPFLQQRRRFLHTTRERTKRTPHAKV